MSDFNTILNRMLNRIPDTFDKRIGSVIYDALAPSAAELAQMYIELEIFRDQTYLLTASGVNLDNRGGDFAIERFPATKAQRIGRVFNLSLQPIDVELGSRFATPSESGGLIYVAVRKIETGVYILESETPGTVGNEYLGDILPLFIRNNLGRAEIVGTEVPARDVETDDDYRERIIARMSLKAFGGNIADYKRFTKDIEGVGDLKVFPAWAGGGTVKLSVVDANFDTITPEFIRVIKDNIDPESDTGLGVGIAPIGHVVTVTTPNRTIINVEATVTLDNRTIGQLQETVEQNIEGYLNDLRRNWANTEVTHVFNIMVATAIVYTEGIINVQNVKLNEESGDLTLLNNPEIQQLPYLGAVTLYEA